MKPPKKTAADPKLELVGLCCRTLDNKNATDIRILDVSEISSITDFLVIATGTSEPHLRALTREVADEVKKAGHQIVGHEMNHESGWTILDAHDVIVHIFLPEIRDLYQLDSLWKDGHEIDLSQFVDESAPTGQQRGH